MDFSFSFKKKPQGHPGQPAPKVNPAQEQFDQLRGCGINLRGKAKLDALTSSTDAGAFEQAPFVQLLVLLGGMQESGEPWSDEVWLWPAGAVTQTGVLAWCVEQLMRLTRGALPLEGVQDAMEGDGLSLAFTLDGEQVQWDVGCENGEPDPTVLSALAGIAAERGDSARLAFCDVEGAGRLLVFMTEPEVGELCEATGLGWAWVE